MTKQYFNLSFLYRRNNISLNNIILYRYTEYYKLTYVCVIEIQN